MDMKTERGKKLQKELRLRRMDSAESALDRIIDQEAEDLMGCPPRERKTHARRVRALESAEVGVLDFVLCFLEEEPEYTVTPHDILSYRCKAQAWAIAQLLLAERRLLPKGTRE